MTRMAVDEALKKGEAGEKSSQPLYPDTEREEESAAERLIWKLKSQMEMLLDSPRLTGMEGH